MNDDDDRSPMSMIGHGRGDYFADGTPASIKPQPSRRPTMSYSIVDEEEAKRRHGGTASARLASTPVETNPKPTTVQDIVTQITEREINAWLSIPIVIRGMMLTSPEKFKLIAAPAFPNDVAMFTFSGMVFKWDGAVNWVLSDFKE